MSAGLTRDPSYRRAAVALTAVLATAAVAVVVARLAAADWLAIVAAMFPLVIAGVGIAGRLGVGLDAVSAIPVGTVVATLVVWLVTLVGYALELPTGVVLAALLVVIAGGVVLAGPVVGSLAVPGRLGGPGRGVGLAIVLGLGVILVATVALGPYYPAGFDSAFHTAALRRLLGSAAWLPPDPFFGPAALPVPQYGLEPWYPVLAVLATIAGRDAMSTISGSVVPLAVIAGLALVAMVRAAMLRSSGHASATETGPLGGSAAVDPSSTTDGSDTSEEAARAAWPAATLALAGWVAWIGGLRAGLDWRLMLLPEQVGLLIVFPVALTALWSHGRPLARRRLVLLGGLAALAAPIHLTAGATLGVVVAGELIVGALQRERAAWLPATVMSVGLAIGVALTAVPLAAMVAAVGADAFGQPVYEARLLHLGPFVMMRPAVLVASTLAVVSLLGAVLVLVLGPRRSGIGGLAGGAVIGWLVLGFPPATTLLVAVAGSMYPTRLVTVPAALGIPLFGVAASLILVRLGERPVPAAWLASGAAGVALVLTAVTGAISVSTVGQDLPTWVSSAGRTAAARPDDRDAIRALATTLGPYLPPGSVVLAELQTAYELPTVLDLSVVAVPAVHSISTDPRRVNVAGHTEAGDDATGVLRRRGPIAERVAVLERYGVTVVVMEPRRSRIDAAAFAAEYGGRLRVVASDLGPDRLAVLAVVPGW